MQNGDINHRIQVIAQNRKIYRLYPLIHYGDFCRFWIDISKKLIYRNFQYWSGRYDTIRYIDIETIYRYNDPSLNKTKHECIKCIIWIYFCAILSMFLPVFLVFFIDKGNDGKTKSVHIGANKRSLHLCLNCSAKPSSAFSGCRMKWAGDVSTINGSCSSNHQRVTVITDRQTDRRTDGCQ